MYIYIYTCMKHLESSESTLIKSQNDRLCPEIPLESSENLQVLARVCDVETTVAEIVLK